MASAQIPVMYHESLPDFLQFWSELRSSVEAALHLPSADDTQACLTVYKESDPIMKSFVLNPTRDVLVNHQSQVESLLSRLEGSNVPGAALLNTHVAKFGLERVANPVLEYIVGSKPLFRAAAASVAHGEEDGAKLDAKDMLVGVAGAASGGAGGGLGLEEPAVLGDAADELPETVELQEMAMLSGVEPNALERSMRKAKELAEKKNLSPAKGTGVGSQSSYATPPDFNDPVRPKSPIAGSLFGAGNDDVIKEEEVTSFQSKSATDSIPSAPLTGTHVAPQSGSSSELVGNKRVYSLTEAADVAHEGGGEVGEEDEEFGEDGLPLSEEEAAKSRRRRMSVGTATINALVEDDMGWGVPRGPTHTNPLVDVPAESQETTAPKIEVGEAREEPEVGGSKPTTPTSSPPPARSPVSGFFQRLLSGRGREAASVKEVEERKQGGSGGPSFEIAEVTGSEARATLPVGDVVPKQEEGGVEKLRVMEVGALGAVSGAAVIGYSSWAQEHDKAEVEKDGGVGLGEGRVGEPVVLGKALVGSTLVVVPAGGEVGGLAHVTLGEGQKVKEVGEKEGVDGKIDGSDHKDFEKVGREGDGRYGEPSGVKRGEEMTSLGGGVVGGVHGDTELSGLGEVGVDEGYLPKHAPAGFRREAEDYTGVAEALPVVAEYPQGEELSENAEYSTEAQRGSGGFRTANEKEGEEAVKQDAFSARNGGLEALAGDYGGESDRVLTAERKAEVAPFGAVPAGAPYGKESLVEDVGGSEKDFPYMDVRKGQSARRSLLAETQEALKEEGSYSNTSPRDLHKFVSEPGPESVPGGVVKAGRFKSGNDNGIASVVGTYEEETGPLVEWKGSKEDKFGEVGAGVEKIVSAEKGWNGEEDVVGDEKKVEEGLDVGPTTGGGLDVGVGGQQKVGGMGLTMESVGATAGGVTHVGQNSAENLVGAVVGATAAGVAATAGAVGGVVGGVTHMGQKAAENVTAGVGSVAQSLVPEKEEKLPPSVFSDALEPVLLEHSEPPGVESFVEESKVKGESMELSGSERELVDNLSEGARPIVAEDKPEFEEREKEMVEAQEQEEVMEMKTEEKSHQLEQMEAVGKRGRKGVDVDERGGKRALVDATVVGGGVGVGGVVGVEGGKVGEFEEDTFEDALDTPVRTPSVLLEETSNVVRGEKGEGQLQAGKEKRMGGGTGMGALAAETAVGAGGLLAAVGLGAKHMGTAVPDAQELTPVTTREAEVPVGNVESKKGEHQGLLGGMVSAVEGAASGLFNLLPGHHPKAVAVVAPPVTTTAETEKESAGVDVGRVGVGAYERGSILDSKAESMSEYHVALDTIPEPEPVHESGIPEYPSEGSGFGEVVGEERRVDVIPVQGSSMGGSGAGIGVRDLAGETAVGAGGLLSGFGAGKGNEIKGINETSEVGGDIGVRDLAGETAVSAGGLLSGLGAGKVNDFDEIEGSKGMKNFEEIKEEVEVPRGGVETGVVPQENENEGVGGAGKEHGGMIAGALAAFGGGAGMVLAKMGLGRGAGAHEEDDISGGKGGAVASGGAGGDISVGKGGEVAGVEGGGLEGEKGVGEKFDDVATRAEVAKFDDMAEREAELAPAQKVTPGAYGMEKGLPGVTVVGPKTDVFERSEVKESGNVWETASSEDVTPVIPETRVDSYVEEDEIPLAEVLGGGSALSAGATSAYVGSEVAVKPRETSRVLEAVPVPLTATSAPVPAPVPAQQVAITRDGIPGSVLIPGGLGATSATAPTQAPAPVPLEQVAITRDGIPGSVAVPIENVKTEPVVGTIIRSGTGTGIGTGIETGTGAEIGFTPLQTDVSSVAVKEAQVVASAPRIEAPVAKVKKAKGGLFACCMAAPQTQN